ncbi:MAG: hypothetical protein ACLTYW_07415 [Collinsella sp.]
MRAHFASCRVFLCSMLSSSTGMATSANSVVRSAASVPEVCTRRLRTCTAPPAAYRRRYHHGCDDGSGFGGTQARRCRSRRWPRYRTRLVGVVQMAIKIGQRGKPASEQLAASVILTGASALRMMRAERRQMGYIS